MTSEALAEGQKVVELNDRILRHYGQVLCRDARILDFGCGRGRHMHEYQDAGYEQVFGFDVHDDTGMTDHAERFRFGFLEPGQPYRIPFPDDHFDFVMSTSVFEHVSNQAGAIAEIARVLKPDGVTIHVFPSRWRPIEPHIFVPFGGVLQERWWLALWAAIGIRNGFQHGLAAKDVVSRNLAYCENGIHYRNTGEIDALWRTCFASVERAESAFIESTRTVSSVSRMLHLVIRMLPGLVNLYRFAHTSVVLAWNPR
jgi:SAM-dependent methyltransferase